MIDFPSADNAAINSAFPALMSGETIVVPLNGASWFKPITVALCGSQRIICAPMSINLSTKNSLDSNIFWCTKRLPFACVATTKMIESKSGVNPGQGASETVRIDPSINFWIL